MHTRTLVSVALVGLMLMLPVPALASHCEHCSGAGCALKASDESPRPVREEMKVWFNRPVQIGGRILLGQYVIEHDTERMARGEPCTHIYKAGDRRLPVVAFHCTHLTGEAQKQPTVSLIPTGDLSGMMKMTAFQFAGDSAAHGVPTGR